MPAGGFLHYIHHFRAVAIVFVVASHTQKALEWQGNALNGTFVSVVFGNGTLLFIFIAGFIFQYLLPKFATWKYYRSKLTNVILPYLVAALPAVLLALARDPPPYFPAGFESWHVGVQILWLYGTGAMLLPLWFIPMIAIFYLLGPVFAAGDRSGTMYRWLPVLYVLSLFIARPEANLNPLQSFVTFLPIYLLGMWSARNRDWLLGLLDRWHWVVLAAWLVVVLLEVFVFSAQGAMYTDDPLQLHADVVNFSKIEKTLLCFLLIHHLHRLQEVVGMRLDVLAETSFAIFFLHEYFVLATRFGASAMDETLHGSVALFVLFTAVVVSLSVVAALGVRRVAGSRSRLLVGA